MYKDISYETVDRRYKQIKIKGYVQIFEHSLFYIFNNL